VHGARPLRGRHEGCRTRPGRGVYQPAAISRSPKIRGSNNPGVGAAPLLGRSALLARPGAQDPRAPGPLAGSGLVGSFVALARTPPVDGPLAFAASAAESPQGLSTAGQRRGQFATPSLGAAARAKEAALLCAIGSNRYASASSCFRKANRVAALLLHVCATGQAAQGQRASQCLQPLSDQPVALLGSHLLDSG